MQLFSRSLLTLSVMLLATQTFAGDIQQVSCNNGCGDTGCTSEGCNGRSGRCRTQRCRKGDYCDANGRNKGSRNGWNNGEDFGGKNGRCGFRGTARDLALDWAGPCSPAGRLARWGCPTAKKFVWCCKTKGYPDSGWAPPANVPLTRTGGSYSRNWVNSSAGGYGPGAPMVYQPTDTTQLGYSYSNVPTWRPNPGMIPAVPNPSNFHNRICPAPAGLSGGGCHGYMMETSAVGGSCDMGYVNLMNRSQAMQLANSRGIRPTWNRPQPQMMAARPAANPVRPVAKTNAVKSNVQQVSNTAAKSVQQPWSNSTNKAQKTQTVRKSSTQRPGKRTKNTRQQSSAGWFGLPSLNEVKI